MMKTKLFAPLMLACLFSISNLFAQDVVTSQTEKAVETKQNIQVTPEQLKLEIEQYGAAIETLKSTPPSEITGGSNYEAKKQHLDKMIAKWENLTGETWKPVSDD